MRILLVHTSITHSSGATAVAAWILAGLSIEHDVTLLTWIEPDRNAMDRFYGTALASRRFAVRTPPRILRALIDVAVRLDSDPYSIQRWALLTRLARRLSRRFDLVVSTDYESDTGPASIQYIHFPYLRDHYKREPANGRSALSQLATLTARCRPWRLLSGFRFDRMRRQTTLVNSNWTKQLVKAAYGIDAVVLHPPAANDFPDIPWAERDDGFICLGRISPEKSIETVLEIVAGVRAHHSQVRLHVVGTRGTTPLEKAYYERIRRLLAEHAAWVFLHENLPRRQLVHLMARQRYGVHAMREEHFGMAVAEMVQAGCIVFTPNDGGQVEITGNHRGLTYDQPDVAVSKILEVMKSPRQQESLRSHLAQQARHLTADRFMDGIREVVRRHGRRQ